jgi:hypothetical protein
LEASPDILVIADSALYVKDKLAEAKYAWITRIPENIKFAKQLVESDKNTYCWQNLAPIKQGNSSGEKNKKSEELNAEI